MSTYTKTCSNNSSYTLRLVLQETSTSINNNSSNITYALYLDSTYPRFEDYDVHYTLKLGNVVNINTTKRMSMPPTRKEPLLLVSGSKSVTHDADGKKSLSVSCSISTITSESYLPGSATISGKIFVLTSLARKSTMSDVVGTIRSPMVLHVNRQSSTFTHTVRYRFGNSSGVIGSAKTTNININWTPPISFYKYIPGKSMGVGELTIETYNGDDLLGRNSYTLTLKTQKIYNVPSILNFKCIRGTGDSPSTWKSSPLGGDVKITFKANVTTGISGNSTTFKILWDSSTIVTESNASAKTYEYYKTGVGTTTTHKATIQISDTIGSSKSYSLVVSTINVPLDVNVEKPSIAVGKIAEEPNTFEVSPDWKFKYTPKDNTNPSNQDYLIMQKSNGDWYKITRWDYTQAFKDYFSLLIPTQVNHPSGGLCFKKTDPSFSGTAYWHSMFTMGVLRIYGQTANVFKANTNYLVASLPGNLPVNSWALSVRCSRQLCAWIASDGIHIRPYEEIPQDYDIYISGVWMYR